MLALLTEADINVDLGIERIREITGKDFPEEVIKKILIEVKKTKNRANHKVYKEL